MEGTRPACYCYGSQTVAHQSARVSTAVKVVPNKLTKPVVLDGSLCIGHSGTEPFHSGANSCNRRRIGPWPILSLAFLLRGHFVPWLFRSPRRLGLRRYADINRSSCLERKFRGHFALGSKSSREREGHVAKGPGANWPGFYWPIRSWERIGLGAKRL